MSEQRRLATIMFTDVVGYTAAMERDERQAHTIAERAHELVRELVEQCGGQWLESVGDGSLSAFSSASQAVDCALAIQNSLISDPDLQLRIGLHLGDVVFTEEGAYGDGVNVASRVHAQAPPGGITATEAIRNAVRGHANVRFSSLGRKRLKNVREPVRIYTLAAGKPDAAYPWVSGGRRAWTAVGILTIALAGAVLFVRMDVWEFLGTRADGPRRIAVLPFEHGEGELDERFADGLTEELINALAQLKELRVTARTSAFYFKNKPLPIPEIADRLGVDYIVEGMVRRSGERLRISAQLIRADEGYEMWSRTYDKEVAEIFSVQQDIAEKVSKNLDVLLDEDKRRRMSEAGIDDIEAFLAYQRGRELYVRAHQEEEQLIQLLIEANGWFDRAIEHAPQFAQAYVYRADLYAHLTRDKAFGKPIPPEAADIADQATQQLRKNWETAVEVAVSDSRRAAFDVSKTIFFGDWSTLPAKIQAVVEAEGCSIAIWISHLATLGMANEVARYGRQLIECDPLYFGGWFATVRAELWADQPTDALDTAQSALTNIQHGSINELRIVALLALENFEDAQRQIEAALSADRERMLIQTLTYAVRGATDHARKTATQYTQEFGPGDSLIVAAWLGDRDEANSIARRLDEAELGHFVLLLKTSQCFCGSPFDLDSTPNFKERIEDAGIPWPPPSPINFPAKNW